MGKRYPRRGVSFVQVTKEKGYFSYRCHDSDRNVVYECPRVFRSGFAARDEIRRRWPGVRISFDVY